MDTARIEDVGMGSPNYGISVKGNVDNRGAMAAGDHAKATMSAPAANEDPGRLLAELRVLFRQHADRLSRDDRMRGRGALEELDEEMTAANPGPAQLSAALETLGASVHTVDGLAAATVKLAEALGVSMRNSAIAGTVTNLIQAGSVDNLHVHDKPEGSAT